MLNMEATKNSQCADLENQLHMSQHALDENAAVLVKVKGQLEKVGWFVVLLDYVWFVPSQCHTRISCFVKDVFPNV